jgi:integrase
MSQKGIKTTTYSLDWETLIRLETRLQYKVRTQIGNDSNVQDLLIISLGSRLGLRVGELLKLTWNELKGIKPGERIIINEQKTGKQRIVIMSQRLRETLDFVSFNSETPENHYVIKSQKSKGLKPMSIQNFNLRLKKILKENNIRFIGNPSSHLLRKTWVVGSIKKGFESGDHLSLVKVSRLIGHSNISTTLRYTNFEVSQSFNLFELN